MGRVAAPYGVRGWLKVQPFTSEPDALLGYERWWIVKDGRPTLAARMSEGRRHGAVIVAKLDGIESREEAARYRGHDVAVARDALPETADGEVYLYELVGLDVVDVEGRALGRVQAIGEGVQPLLRVAAGNGSERLIPFVPQIVREVDLETSRLVVDWQPDE